MNISSHYASYKYQCYTDSIALDSSNAFIGQPFSCFVDLDYNFNMRNAWTEWKTFPPTILGQDGGTNAKEGWGERQTLGSIKLKMHHKDESTIKKIIRGITGFRGNQEE